MRYNEIAPKKLSKKDAKEAAKQAEFKVRFDKEQAEREVSKKKIDAFKNAISPYMGKQEVAFVSAEERVVEQMLTATPWYGERKPFFVYKNPTIEEYDRAIGDSDGVRAFVKGNDLYVWKTGAGIHAVVYEQLKLTDAIPLYMYAHMGGPCEVMVTDCIKRTKWSRNKSKVAAAILKCGFLREHFKRIAISYYDEGIVGDWKDLPSF